MENMNFESAKTVTEQMPFSKSNAKGMLAGLGFVGFVGAAVLVAKNGIPKLIEVFTKGKAKPEEATVETEPAETSEVEIEE